MVGGGGGRWEHRSMYLQQLPQSQLLPQSLPGFFCYFFMPESKMSEVDLFDQKPGNNDPK